MKGTVNREQGEGTLETAPTPDPLRSYKDLTVWQKSFQLTIDVYQLTKSFSPEERYGLTNQMRRAAYSIPTNIAEGYRRSTKEYKHFLSIAIGSASELETFTFLVKELRFREEEDVKEILLKIDEISRMLFSLTSRLKC